MVYEISMALELTVHTSSIREQTSESDARSRWLSG